MYHYHHSQSLLTPLHMFWKIPGPNIDRAPKKTWVDNPFRSVFRSGLPASFFLFNIKNYLKVSHTLLKTDKNVK